MTDFNRNKILRYCLLAGLCLTVTSIFAANEDAGPARSLVLTAGRDSQNNRLADASLLVAVNDRVLLDAGIGANRINDVDTAFTTRDLWIGASTMRPAGFNLRIGARAWGERQTIETMDYSFDLSYQTHRGWRSSVMFERGDVTLYIDPSFSTRITSLNTGRSAWGISTEHTAETGSAWVSYNKRTYERDLSLLNSNRVLQTVIKSFALDQAYALSSDEFNLGYEWYLEGFDLGLQYSRVISVVDNNADDYLQLSGRYYSDDSTSLHASMQNSLDDDLVSFSIGLGLLF